MNKNETAGEQYLFPDKEQAIPTNRERSGLGKLVDISEILPEDFTGSSYIAIPPDAFTPDQWTETYLKGLSKVDFTGEKVYEVGVGSGITPLYLAGRNQGHPREIVFSDLNGELTCLTLANLHRALQDFKLKNSTLTPRFGDIDLADGIKAKDNIDTVLACIPQVPKPEGVNIDEADNLAHYFIPVIRLETRKKIKKLYDQGTMENLDDTEIDWCLSLCDRLLEQAQGFLKDGGKVILNLSGRPGQKLLERLFEINGFKPELLHQSIVRQHPDTCLRELVKFEAKGHKFEFFSDERCENLITVAESEKRRQEGREVYHKIYVYKGIKL